ncbi:ATP-binding cassette transporter, putative [Phytophthora infestans T30-4]|uniref:ATP-binding cassette transporter, putative n=1 Tax=Phytophthora infestans (strain T30-4) TaxID=403677 RepID=D0NDC7_PHYIT|nr:ATP-binding cassette transporter, putative [Phytophthora infestans T30-4]EEY56084.1 ATP-binding cassette transporter, putative [Phytophthora infestans T30-4]|eukprot:XP_002902914.1 ATP-binding cassette transporter, putative [Phytophthora infestans T30-4]
MRTLLWKNYTLKRRHLLATVFEIALPCIFVLLLGALKHLVDDVDVPAVPTELPKWTQYETSVTGLLWYMARQSVADGMKLNELSTSAYKICTTGVAMNGHVDANASSESSVPTECGGRVVPYKIAVVPDNTFTREYFIQTMKLWYPRVNILNLSNSLQFASLSESVAFFDSEEALEAYVKGKTYGSSLDNPKIYGGIVFDKYPSSDEIGSFSSIEYTLRLSSTETNSGALGLIPPTNGNAAALYPSKKSISTDYYTRYTLTGFMTLQTLVTRFVTCMPDWDAAVQTTSGQRQREQSTAAPSDDLDENLLEYLQSDAILKSAVSERFLLTPLRQAPQPYLGSSVAPFPIEAYSSSPFYDDISGVFAIIFILSYLYTTSRILVVFIQEKELRLREYMKILGVKEPVIIATWYITYTLIQFLSAVLQAVSGLIGLFANSSVLVIFLFFFLFGLSVLCFAFFISTLFSNARTGSFVGMILFFLMYFVAQAFTDDSPEPDITQACIMPPVALSFGLSTIADFETSGIGANFGNLDTLNVNFRLSTALQVIPKQYGTSLNAELREQERRGEALSVQNLRKTFEVPGGTKVAVKGLNLVMYKDQITCLLGHNGAGKSTLISMLTGMTAPSNGDAKYRGLSSTEDIEEIRESLGIGFQHDVLFEDLTVQEHLLVFGRVKEYRNAALVTLVESQIRIIRWDEA